MAGQHQREGLQLQTKHDAKGGYHVSVLREQTRLGYEQFGCPLSRSRGCVAFPKERNGARRGARVVRASLLVEVSKGTRPRVASELCESHLRRNRLPILREQARLRHQHPGEPASAPRAPMAPGPTPDPPSPRRPGGAHAKSVRE